MLGSCPGVVVLGLVLLQNVCGMTSVYLWGGGQRVQYRETGADLLAWELSPPLCCHLALRLCLPLLERWRALEVTAAAGPGPGTDSAGGAVLSIWCSHP